jgi:multicomponent K+:H+ antiporter subunit E
MTPGRERPRATILPQPVLSVVLLVVWLLAQNSFSLGLVLLGAMLAMAIPLATHRFWPDYPKRLRFPPLVRLAGILVLDILVANARIARLILGPRARLRPTFFAFPVTLRGDYPVTLLASIISLTPGTVSADLSPDRRTLLVHGLDVHDAPAAIAHIRQRYERLLMEAFE